jgi:hypothetical protein
MPFYKTAGVARLLGESYTRIFWLIRTDKIEPPHKDSSGDYVWLPEDIDRVRAALKARDERKAVLLKPEVQNMACNDRNQRKKA